MKKLSFPTVKLGNFIREVKEKVKSSGLFQDDFTVYGVTNTDGITVTNNKASDDLGNYTILRENQFVYNPYRVNVGSIGLSSPGTFGAVSPAYVVFETNKQINNEFLLYYLKSSLGTNLIKWYGDRGGVRSALRFSDLKKIDFPDITLEQQNKLLIKIKKLDELLCELDINLSIDKIEVLRQSILQQAVEGKLCEQDPNDEPASVLLEKIKAEKERLIAEKKIKKQKQLPPISNDEKPFALPKGWEWCRLGEICQFVGGFAYKSNRYSKRSNNLVIRLGNVKNDKLLTETNPVYIDDFYANETDQYKINIGDILVTMTGTRGKRDYFYSHCITVDDLSSYNMFLNQRVGCLRSIAPIHPAYLVKFLKSQIILDYIFATETGTANQGNIGSGNIMMIPLPIAPLKEQRRIVEKIDALFLQCDEFEHSIFDAQIYSAQLMEAVLQEAFSVQEVEKPAQVIEFQTNQTAPETELLAAARGKMGEVTWQRIVEEAMKLASEEN